MEEERERRGRGAIEIITPEQKSEKEEIFDFTTMMIMMTMMMKQ